jgi:hypothetical protein
MNYVVVRGAAAVWQLPLCLRGTALSEKTQQKAGDEQCTLLRKKNCW